MISYETIYKSKIDFWFITFIVTIISMNIL